MSQEEIKLTSDVNSSAIQAEIVKVNQVESGQISRIVQQATALMITTVEQSTEANIILRAIKERYKAVEDQRKRLTTPLRNAIEELNGFFKRILAPLETAEQIVKGKLMGFEKAERDRVAAENLKIQREREKIEKQQEKANKIAAKAGVAPVALPKPELKTVETRTKTVKRWTFEVVDKTKIPMDYLIADETKIGVAVRQMGIREIPGVRIFEEESVRV